MLMPKKVKYRKQQRGKNRGIALRGSTISFGDYGLQAIERGWLTARQMDGQGKRQPRGMGGGDQAGSHPL